MRIISGQHKGRKISAPKQLPIRPTTDMAKEALFNIINNQYYLDEISVLDLFSGSGNISYEFASRGVNAITAVEIHAGCTQFISEMAEKLDMPIEVIKSDVFAYLQKTPKKFNIIFADPPCALPIYRRIPTNCSNGVSKRTGFRRRYFGHRTRETYGPL